MLVPWPAFLPQWPLWEFDGQPRHGLSRPEDVLHPWPVRTRPEQDGRFAFLVTTTQLEKFWTWVREALCDGAAPFEGPWLETAGYPGCFLRLGEHPPQASHLGHVYWRLVLDVEIMAGVTP